MTQQYSDDNPYAKLRLVSDPAFGADYGIGLRADTLKQVAISKADCWEEGYHHHAEEVAKLRTKWESLKRDYAVLLQSHEWQQGVLVKKEAKMARLRETHAIEVERLSNTCDAYKSRILANGDRLEMVYHEVRELRAENEKLQKTLEMAESQLVRDIASEAFNDACKNLAQAKAENEVLRKRFGDCARCYDTQQGIEDILVNQIIDLRTENILVDQIVALRAENEELRLALVKYKEAQAEIEACQELEAKKQGNGQSKDAVL